MVSSQIVEQAASVLCDDGSYALAFDELHHAIDWARRKHAVRRHAQVEVLVAQQAIHEREELHHQLVLAQIVAVLENDAVRRRPLRCRVGVAAACLSTRWRRCLGSSSSAGRTGRGAAGAAAFKLQEQRKEIALEDGAGFRRNALYAHARIERQRQHGRELAQPVARIRNGRAQLVDLLGP
jgi:hypothetical protein